MRRRGLRRLLFTAAIACAAMGPGTGCSIVNGLSSALRHNDCIDEFMVSYRNRAWSAKSWHANKHRFCDQQHNREFEAGYRAGYENVASGGDGCTPSLPPRQYWGWRYQSPEGQAKVGAWFAGFPHGAAAAERDGLKHWGELRTMAPQQATMPPAEDPPGPMPRGGAPTPLENLPPEATGEGSVLSGAAPRGSDFSDLDMSAFKTVTADSVPTAATGQP
jgi:hypothetical protein